MTSTPIYLPDNLAELWLMVGGFDDLLLTGDTVDADGYEYTIRAFGTSQQGGDLSWGTAQPIDVSVQRWMAEGAIASTQGHDDRTITFFVKVSAATSVALAVGEAALQARAEGMALLKWVPMEGADFAPASVFEVWTWHLAHLFDQGDEMRLTRGYAVTMTAKPSARSEFLTVADAATTSASPTITEVDDCTSTSGWTSPIGAVTTSGGAVKIASATSAGVARTTMSLTRTGLVTGMGVTPYLMLNTSASHNPQNLAATVDGRAMTKVGQVGATSYWQMPAGKTSFTKLVISVSVASTAHDNNLSLSVADVSKTDAIGAVGSRKQLTRSLEVGGSVKTSGSIEVASPDATPFNTVLVYTQPDNGQGYNPGLRQYRTSGNTVTPDSTANSGSNEAFPAFSPVTYDIPGDALPEATYAVVVRFKSDTIGTMPLVLDSSVDGYFDDRSFFAGSVDFDATNTWTWVVIGVIGAPNQALPAESNLASIITIVASSVPGTVLLDEVYLLDVTHGAFTLLHVGGVATRLWIDAPDADPVRNRPAIYIGTLDDRSDAAAAPGSSILARGDHDLDPGGVVLATVTDNVDNAVVSASFYHRHNTHATD